MSGYSDGRRVEYAVTHDLADNGYRILRGASSKGFADVCAVKYDEVLFVNCKRTTMPRPAERADLVSLAALLPGIGVPLVALKPLGQGTPSYRRLTGPGPRDWFEWSPDYLIDQGDVPDDGSNSDPWSA